MDPPLIFEALAIAFFAVITVAAPLTRAPRARQLRVALLSSTLIVGVAAAIQTLRPEFRVWIGHAYLAAGYWMPALLVSWDEVRSARCTVHRAPCTHTAFEAWLVRTDEHCRRLIAPPPGWAVQLLELAYLFCYLLVPVAFVLVWTAGTTAEADRFWSAVLLAGLACYGSLPWLVSRPPRWRDTTPASGIRRFNVYVLGHVSHGLNTFPSGHVAVSIAAALEVLSVSRPAGVALMVTAGAIAAGAVAGRYHYAVDVALGLTIGIAASMLM